MPNYSGFNENAEHFFNHLNTDFYINKKENRMNLDNSNVNVEWGSELSKKEITIDNSKKIDKLNLDVEPIDKSSYDFLDKSYRDNIMTIESAISQIEGEIIPGAHPKLLESYAQLLEKRTAAITAYTEFLKLRRKAEIEERKLRIAEKKAGISNEDSNSSGFSMTPKQLAEFIRELESNRHKEVNIDTVDIKIENNNENKFIDKGIE